MSSFTCLLIQLRWLAEMYRRFSAPSTCRCSSLFVHGRLTRAEFVSLCRLSVATHILCFAHVFSGWFALLSTNRWTTGAVLILGFASSHLHPYCDDTIRAARLRGWLSKRLAFGARVTSCSSFRFTGGKLSPVFPDASVHSCAHAFSSPEFSWKVQPGVYGLPREARLLSPTLGFAACSSAASPSLCSAWRARPPLKLAL